MISIKEVREAIRNVLITGTVIADTSIAWEGRKFDPTGKTIWLQELIAPDTETSLTEQLSTVLVAVQYNVVTPAGSGTEAAETLVNSIKALFSINATATNTITLTSGDKLTIESIEQIPAETIDAWRYTGVRLYLTINEG